MQLSNKAKALLAAQRDRYKSSLADRRVRIKAAWNQWTEDQTGPDKLAALIRTIHQLAGSAGYFGFDDLGKQARSLEQVLRNLPEDSTMDELEPAFRSLLLAFDAAIAS